MPTAAEEFGKIIGDNIRDTQDLNQSMSHSAGEDTNIIFPTETIEIIEIAARAKKRLIGNAFVLGHADNGALGTDALGVGTRGSWTIHRVVSPNNTFKEFFASNSYQDTTNTTASLNTTNEEVTFTDEQIYQTDIIFKNAEAIKSVKPTVTLRSALGSINIDTTFRSQTLDIYCD